LRPEGIFTLLFIEDTKSLLFIADPAFSAR